MFLNSFNIGLAFRFVQKLLLATSTTLLIGTTSAFATDFEEGEHYTEFDVPRTDKPSIVEIYSVFCPGCYAFEANYQMIKNNIPDNVKFERHHSWGMVGTNPEAMDGIAKLNAISDMFPNELGNKLMWEVFVMIHEKKQTPVEADLHRILGQHNHEVEQSLSKLYDSFPIRSMIARSKKEQKYWQSEGLTKGTPTWIINGRYRINIGELDRNNFFKEFYALTNYLLSK